MNSHPYNIEPYHGQHQPVMLPPVYPVHISSSPHSPQTAHWRGVVIGICVVGVFVLLWKLIDAMANSDGLGIALGICLGVLAGIPTMLLFVAMERQ